ncbi:MAG TPA: NADH-quinone oxidoreductase subunit D [Chloroflexota bacterium]|nr:NADH-quinone oxidoreductase subunit D [Chloroflexota bacterium]
MLTENPTPNQPTLEEETEQIVMNMGPQHPSTHGVFRMILTLSGETIVKADLEMGYLHRGVEKQCEEGTFVHNVTLTDRLDYLAAMSNNLSYSMAAEQLAGVEVPERGWYIRTIVCELQRIASHCIAVGTFGADVGTMFTPLTYAFREREMILDMFNMVCGARMTLNYVRPGGVALDLPEEFIPACRYFLDIMPAKIDEYEALLTTNEIFTARTRGVGVLPKERALDYAVSGPTLRGSGSNYDVRRNAPYGIYDRFDFNVMTETGGDCFSRYLVRVREMRESVKIVKQAIENLPGGPHSAKLSRNFRAAAGETFSRIEAPKGELGFYMVSDGSIAPYRCKIRAPSFINLGPLREMLVGHKVADAVVILGSIDIVLGEVDR